MSKRNKPANYNDKMGASVIKIDTLITDLQALKKGVKSARYLRTHLERYNQLVRIQETLRQIRMHEHRQMPVDTS